VTRGGCDTICSRLIPLTWCATMSRAERAASIGKFVIVASPTQARKWFLAHRMSDNAADRVCRGRPGLSCATSISLNPGAVDKAVADDILATDPFIACHQEYPIEFGLGPTSQAVAATAAGTSAIAVRAPTS
jgi:hypothetical protein